MRLLKFSFIWSNFVYLVFVWVFFSQFFLFFILCVYCARQRCWSLLFSSNFQWMTFFLYTILCLFRLNVWYYNGKKTEICSCWTAFILFICCLVPFSPRHTILRSFFGVILFFAPKYQNTTDKKRMKRTTERTRPNRFVIFHFY